MSGVGAAVASGAGDLLGSWYNNSEAVKRQHGAQDYESGMFNTRYQRTVADLQAAGLNPMLAYQQGPGSAPSSSAASAPASNLGSHMVGSYNQTKLASAQEANINAQTEKEMATTRNIDADTIIKIGMPDVNQASAGQARANTDKIRAEIPKVQSEISQLEAQVKKIKAMSN